MCADDVRCIGSSLMRAKTIVALLFLALTLTGCGAGPPPASQSGHSGMDMNVQPKELARLPEFTFQDLAGRDVSAQEFAGKVLLVDVWATWCPPCKEEMPWFQELQDKYGAQGLEVIGISIDPNPADAARYAKELGVTYRLLHHPQIMQEWGLLGLPTTFIVDRDRRIHRKIVGFDYKETFETAVRELLESEPGA
jgi:thiol-disulfide isomerase/thioredoxin